MIVPDDMSIADVQLVLFDFDGVFTDNWVIVDQNGIESVRCSRSDGLGLSRLAKVGLPAYIVSTEANPVVTMRAKKMQLPVRQSIQNKEQAVREISEEFSIDLKNIMYVGNDINDISALKIVGFPVGVADAFPEILPFIRISTMKKGGEGAVREICDHLYHAKQQAL